MAAAPTRKARPDVDLDPTSCQSLALMYQVPVETQLSIGYVLAGTWNSISCMTAASSSGSMAEDAWRASWSRRRHS